MWVKLFKKIFPTVLKHALITLLVKFVCMVWFGYLKYLHSEHYVWALYVIIVVVNCTVAIMARQKSILERLDEIISEEETEV